MDHHIFNYSWHRWEEPSSLDYRLYKSLKEDDKDEFLSVIKDPRYPRQLNDGFWEHSIVDYDAVKIANAVFNGETEGIISLDDDFSPDYIFRADAVKIANAVFNGEIGVISFEDIESPLHVAAFSGARKITKYLIERGDRVDALCDDEFLDLKQATYIDVAVERFVRGVWRPWTPRKSIFELLVYVCGASCRRRLETVRLLVQKTKNKERVKQSLVDYANNGKLVQFAALFIAAPELFLSSYFFILNNFLEKKRARLLFDVFSLVDDIRYDGLSLMLDLFTVAGHKLVAYTRIGDPSEWVLGACPTHFIGCLLREFADTKQEISNPDDYFLRFFKPQNSDINRKRLPHELRRYEDYEYCDHDPYPIRLKRKDIDIDYINKKVMHNGNDMRLESWDAELKIAIEKKLLSMADLRDQVEDIARLSKHGMKRHSPQGVGFSVPSSGSSFELGVRSYYCTSAICSKQRFNFKNNWEKKAKMKPNRLVSFFSAPKLSTFPMILKLLIK